MSAEFLIVGQGLAGTTTAWRLWQRNQRFRIVDSMEPVTASKIAAGLVTPVTGKKQVLTRDWSLYWSEADKFYRAIEDLLQIRIWEECGAIRWFLTDQERQQFLGRLGSGGYSGIDIQEISPVITSEVHAPLGGYHMQPAARLNLPEYLTASRTFFEQHGMFEAMEVRAEDFVLTETAVTLPRLDAEFNCVIWCTGYREATSGQFREIDFRPVKGEILTVSLPQEIGRETWHFGGWLAPVPGASKLFRTGSTYDWDRLDQVPTSNAVESILAKLAQVISGTPVIRDQVAAVRPAVSDASPVIGRHRQYPQFAILNGLGAKGTLWAPRAADVLVAAILNGEPIPSDLTCHRWQR